MNNREHLIEQHVLEYEARLKHIDELVDKADQNIEALDDVHLTELQEIKKIFERLNHAADHDVLDSSEGVDRQLISMSGPMAIWDAVAQRLEHMIEHFESNKT